MKFRENSGKKFKIKIKKEIDYLSNSFGNNLISYKNPKINNQKKGEGMTITQFENGDSLTLAVEGIIDSTTAPDFEKEMLAAGGKTKNLVVNFAKVDFISSAGLRVLLLSQKKMAAAAGKMTLVNVSEDVREVFELTGFVNVLDIA